MEDGNRVLSLAHEGTITVNLARFEQTMGQLRKNQSGRVIKRGVEGVRERSTLLFSD